MPRVQVITTNFTGGEFSPRLRGRVDLERYNSSAEIVENCVVLRQGGVTIRPSRDYKGEIKSSTQTGRIVPFVYSRTDAYILEFGNLVMRVWKNGALVETSPGVAYELATPWTAAQLATIDFTQGADTLIVAHGSVPTQRIRRFSDSQWECAAAPFLPAALGEVGYRSATISMTISSGAVGTGRTLTASAGFFLAAYIGQSMKWGTGVAVIQTVASATSATATVTAAFDSTSAAAGVWLLEGTPVTTATPSLATPVGATMTVTLAAAGWASGDVGKFVEINGGLVELTSLDGTNPTTVANGVIRRELTGTSAAPIDSWVLLGALWNPYDGYPASCTFYQQRLWLGGTTRYPQTMWGSRSALFFDFTPGTADDAAVYKTIDSDDINVIQHLVSAGHLVAMTYGGEFDIRGGVEKPITQLNAQITQRSRWGAEQVRPEQVGRDLIFVQRGGRALRALFVAQGEESQTRDISVFSEHLLAAGVKSMAWEQTPEQVLWVATTDGKLLAITYSDEQTTVAFCSGNAEGVVEWVATVPDGSVDATYCLVRYTINGATKRYIERLNWSAAPGLDSRKTASGGPADVFFGFGHLEGKTVAVLADGVYVGTAMVTSGAVATPRAATSIEAGLPYTARVRLPAPEIGTGTGTAQAQAMSTHKISVRFLETVGCNVNGRPLEFRRFDVPATLDQPVPEFTGFKDVTDYGWQVGESPLELSQPQPYPWTVLSVVRSITVNTG